MSKYTFSCIDAHTCGNPVRVVSGGGPLLAGKSMSERRQHFLAEFDWIRTGLMFEPRGHDMMSGSLPMCGHGTIGTVTVAVENGLVRPKTPGTLRLETPAGLVIAEYNQVGEYVESVRLTNVPAFLHSEDLEIDAPEIGPIKVDVAYGGNFYAIVEPQQNYRDMADFSAGDLVRLSPILRQR